MNHYDLKRPYLIADKLSPFSNPEFVNSKKNSNFNSDV